jgi:hypothetical protein
MVKARVLSAVGIVAVVGTIAAVMSAQTPASPTFDVASVKPNKSGTGRFMIEAQPGGRFIASNVTLQMLILDAYRPLQNFQLSGAPSWLGVDRFDIVAKTGIDIMDAFAAERRPGAEPAAVDDSHASGRSVQAHCAHGEPRTSGVCARHGSKRRADGTETGPVECRLRGGGRWGRARRYTASWSVIIQRTAPMQHGPWTRPLLGPIGDAIPVRERVCEVREPSRPGSHRTDRALRCRSHMDA